MLNQCWFSRCRKTAEHDITYDNKPIKVCNDHKERDGKFSHPTKWQR